jgi:hypothetical protein
MSATIPALNEPDTTALALVIREKIVALEQAISTLPGAVFGDTSLCPLVHLFAEGVYARRIFIPAGTLIVGKIHKEAHFNMLLEGEVLVVTETGGHEHLVAPLFMMSLPGTKRAVYAIENTTWITVHSNVDNTQDIAVLESRIICPSYAAYEAERAAREEELP